MELTPDELKWQQFYQRQFPRLLAIAVSELQIPKRKAERLVQDLLITNLFRATPPPNIDVWLEGALRVAASRLAEVPA